MKYNKSEIMKNAWVIRRKENISMSSALKKAWAKAKKQEEEKMDNSEIKSLIEKYHIEMRADGKIGTRANVNKNDFMREVPPHKAEIIAYFKAEEQAKKEKEDREKATFNAIPGVLEIEEARKQYRAWKKAFNDMMESGASRMPENVSIPKVEIQSLEDKYPLAVFALEARSRATYTENIRLSSIWEKTYQAIKDGKDLAAVKADHDARMSAYVQDVIFD